MCTMYDRGFGRKCTAAAHWLLRASARSVCGPHAWATHCSVCNRWVLLESAAIWSHCSQGLGHSAFISLTLLPSHLIPICSQIEFPVPSLTFKPSGGLAPSAWLAWRLQVSRQWPIKCPLLLVLEPRRPSHGAAAPGYAPWPFSLLGAHHARCWTYWKDFWLKTELVFIPYLAVSAVCFFFFSSQSRAEQPAYGWVIWWTVINWTIWGSFIWPFASHIMSDLFAYGVEITSDWLCY